MVAAESGFGRSWDMAIWLLRRQKERGEGLAGVEGFYWWWKKGRGGLGLSQFRPRPTTGTAAKAWRHRPDSAQARATSLDERCDRTRTSAVSGRALSRSPPRQW